MPRQELVIAPPIRGQWVIYNPPGHPNLAFDFLAVDESKSLYRKGNFLRHLLSFISVEDTFTWSQPVFSPVAGVVVESHDIENDREKISFGYDLLLLLFNKPKVSDGFRAFGGNYIMIQADDAFVLLCHLRHGSAMVQTGDVVKVGQQVAEVGNSGSSIQPHLHVQVMSNDRYFPLFANLLPFKFSSGNVKLDGGWSKQRDIVLNNRAHYRFDGADS